MSVPSYSRVSLTSCAVGHHSTFESSIKWPCRGSSVHVAEWKYCHRTEQRELTKGNIDFLWSSDVVSWSLYSSDTTQFQWKVWPSSIVKLPWPPLRCFIVACTAIGLYKQCTQSVGWSFTDELPCTGYILHHCTLSNSAEVHIRVLVTGASVAVGVWGWAGEVSMWVYMYGMYVHMYMCRKI